MANIVRGTTPTIKYTFSTVDPASLSVAILTAKQGGAIKLEKDLTAATVGTDYLAWTLSQADTLALSAASITFLCNWKKEDGTRGVSAELTAMVSDNHKNEVI